MAYTITEAVDGESHIDRSTHAIELLGEGIRADLAAMASHEADETIPEQGFLQYVNGPLRKRLSGMKDPAADFA
jgi:hypothetical protein